MSASNELYAGDVVDFEQAMNLVIESCDDEIRESRQRGDKINFVEAYQAAARHALARYLATVRVAELQLAAELSASEDEDVSIIGEALAERDYTGLAI